MRDAWTVCTSGPLPARAVAPLIAMSERRPAIVGEVLVRPTLGELGDTLYGRVSDLPEDFIVGRRIRPETEHGCARGDLNPHTLAGAGT